jgi:hypothetical protein
MNHREISMFIGTSVGKYINKLVGKQVSRITHFHSPVSQPHTQQNNKSYTKLQCLTCHLRSAPQYIVKSTHGRKVVGLSTLGRLATCSSAVVAEAA